MSYDYPLNLRSAGVAVYAAAAVHTAAVVLGCHWSLLPLLLLGLRTLTLGFGWVSSCIRWSHGHWP